MEETTETDNTRTKKIALIGAAVVAAIVVVCAGFWIFMYASYSNKALPNTSVYGVDVSGMTTAEIEATLENKIDDVTVTVDVKGTPETLKITEIGAQPKVAEMALDAVSKPSWTDYFTAVASQRTVELDVDFDSAQVKRFVTTATKDNPRIGRSAKVVINEEDGSITVEPSVKDEVPQTDTLVDALTPHVKQLTSANLTLEFKEITPEYDTDAALKVADALRDDMARPISIGVGEDSLTPSDEVKRGIFRLVDAEDESQTIETNTDSLAEWASEAIDEKQVSVRNGRRKVFPDGKVAKTLVAAREGFEVTNKDDVIAKMREAVGAGQPFEIKAETRVIEPEFSDIQVNYDVADKAYLAEPDEKWIDVNLSNHTISAYIGGSLQRGPIAVVHGDRYTPTVVGTFKVYWMLESKTMRGPGYVAPDVPWVMFFHRGYAIHGAYWRDNFDYDPELGSHGCVNLPVPEAKWFYDFGHVGMVVVTHY